VKHYFESNDHRRDFLSGVLSGQVSLKFAYAGSSARTHDSLARSDGYRSVTLAAELEAALLSTQELPRARLSLIDVGSGNGDHTIGLLSRLLAHGFILERLTLCDFSEELMSMASERIADAFPKLTTRSMVWDIELTSLDLTGDWSEDSVLLLVGHTIGNPDRPDRVLQHLRASVPDGAPLLLSVSLRSSDLGEADVLMPYRTDVFESAVLEPFLALGIRREALEFEVSFEADSVIGIVTLVEQANIDGAVIPSGHRTLAFKSKRFAASEVFALLESARWRPIASRVDNGHLAIFARAVS